MIQSIPRLTNNSIYDIMVNKIDVRTAILQVIQIKEMSSRNSSRMFKLAISDGEYYAPAILSSKLNEKIDSGDIQKNSIVLINEYYLIPSVNKDKLIIKGIEPFCLFSSLIGKPHLIFSNTEQSVQRNDDNNSFPSSQDAQNSQDTKIIFSPPLPNIQNKDETQITLMNNALTGRIQQLPQNEFSFDQPQQINYTPDQNQGSDQYSSLSQNSIIDQESTVDTNPELIHDLPSYYPNTYQNTSQRHACIGIDLLNPYICNWSILARVTLKGSMLNYTRDGKSSKLFNITMKDKTDSEIRGTFYNDQADIFYPIIEQDQVYQISGGLIREKNSRFNSTLHDYEICFNSTTTFVPMIDDHTIGKLTYRFKKLSTLPNISPKTTVDILGYVITVGPIQVLTSKYGDKTYEKRDIVICDDTNVKCDMTLWEDVARDFPSHGGFIVAFKDAKLSDFKGRTLSSSSTLIINPTWIDEAEKLQRWIFECISENGFDFDKMESISSGSEVTRSSFFLSQINDLDFSNNEKSEYGSSIVSISDIIVSKKIYYNACPNPECKFKGLSTSNDGSFFCSKCQKIIEKPAYRYMFSVKVKDFSGSTYMSLIGDDQIGAIITGMTAEELKERTDELDETEIRKLIQEKFFTELNVKYRIKSEEYNGNNQVKINIFSAQPLNYKEGALFFANEISKFS